MISFSFHNSLLSIIGLLIFLKILFSHQNGQQRDAPTSTRTNEIQVHMGKNPHDNELPTSYDYWETGRRSDSDNDLSIYRIPRRKLLPKMEKLSGGKKN